MTCVETGHGMILSMSCVLLLFTGRVSAPARRCVWRAVCGLALGADESGGRDVGVGAAHQTSLLWSYTYTDTYVAGVRLAFHATTNAGSDLEFRAGFLVLLGRASWRALPQDDDDMRAQRTGRHGSDDNHPEPTPMRSFGLRGFLLRVAVSSAPSIRLMPSSSRVTLEGSSRDQCVSLGPAPRRSK